MKTTVNLLLQLVRLVKKVWKYWLANKLDEHEREFIKHNTLKWGKVSKKQKDLEILVEVNDMSTCIIAYSYVVNVLASRFGAVIKAYEPVLYHSRVWPMITLRLNKLFKIYSSFNAKPFYLLTTNKQTSQAKMLYAMIKPTLKTKQDVECLSVDGVWIGDMIYDTYTMRYKVPTIKLTDNTFKQTLMEALTYYVYWRDYLKTHAVKAMIVSHTCYYPMAMGMRIAINQDIPVYHATGTVLMKFNKENYHGNQNYFHFPEMFKKLSPALQKKALKMAQNRLQRRFRGDVGVDMYYSKKSAFTPPDGKRYIRRNNKVKVLIAAHCFFDNPHAFGINLFPDFYEWIDFLGGLSQTTDYQWYIKTHPDFISENVPIIKGFIKKYPKITWLPPHLSHLQIIQEGIDVVLTVYGTVGLEYPFFGVPVINACVTNPRFRYRFNINPQSLTEYKTILTNLRSLKRPNNKRQIFEFYYMWYLDNDYDWLFSDVEAFIRSVGDYSKQFTSATYTLFRQDWWSPERNHEIIETVNRFIESGSYNMRRFVQ